MEGSKIFACECTALIITAIRTDIETEEDSETHLAIDCDYDHLRNTQVIDIGAAAKFDSE